MRRLSRLAASQNIYAFITISKPSSGKLHGGRSIALGVGATSGFKGNH